MGTKNLCFCSYNKKANSYWRIKEPAYWIGENNFLHFVTPYAGDIIIGEGVFVKSKRPPSNKKRLLCAI